MIHGPSAGPAMVLNILMRWPPLIVILLLGGTGTVVYDRFAFPQAEAALKLEAHNEPTVKELLQEPPRLEQNTMVHQAIHPKKLNARK